MTHIITDDCVGRMRAMIKDGAVFDAVITDPPYGIGGRQSIEAMSGYQTINEGWDTIADYRKFTYAWLDLARQLVRPNGAIIVFGSRHSIYTVGSIMQAWDMKIADHIVWRKINATPNITCRSLKASTEHIIWAVNNSTRKATGWTFNYRELKDANGGKQMTDVWDFNVTSPREKKHGKHPSQKPIALMQRLVGMVTDPGDSVLDPFAGTGTTILAALQLGRLGIGIERDPAYVDIAARRISGVL